MRIWSLHPQYLDTKGLLALWRETLLAQKVLQGKTKGYKNHPQLLRFKNTKDPLAFIGAYLYIVAQEAVSRNYSFDQSKILKKGRRKNSLSVTNKQVLYETQHLLEKLRRRDPARFRQFKGKKLKLHPLFYSVSGPVESWEKIL